MIPKHYFTMDKNFGEIGRGAKEKTNILSRGPPPMVSYTKISNGRIDPKIGWNTDLILLYIYTKFQPLHGSSKILKIEEIFTQYYKI